MDVEQTNGAEKEEQNGGSVALAAVSEVLHIAVGPIPKAIEPLCE